MNISPSISRLPVELLISILQLILRVPDHELTSPFTRFGRLIRPSSEYLLVSKHWLAHGLPLLYRTVVLRSAAQVSLLRMTLLGRADLGLLVRNLRIEEGAFYVGLEHITERTPNVQTLVFSLVVYKAVEPSIVCNALSHLKPGKLVLHDPGSTITRNCSLDKIVEAICTMVVKNTSLEAFEWHVRWSHKVFALPRTFYFADALSRAPGLRLVAISASRNVGVPGFIATLLDKSNAERICIVDCPKRMKRKIRDSLSSKRGDLKRVEYYEQFNELYANKGVRTRRVKHGSSLLSTLPEPIIRQIVELALSSVELLNEDLFDDDVDDTGLPAFKKTFCTLTLVSKSFQSFVQEFKFLSVAITNFYHGMLFLNDFSHKSRVGTSLLVRGVYINSYPRAISSMEHQARDIVLNALCSMSNLTELALPARPSDIRLMSQHLGSTLVKLSLCLESDIDYEPEGTNESTTLDPDCFSGFVSLEVLWLRCPADLPFGADFAVSLQENNAFTTKKVKFEKLRVLTIQDYENCQIFELIANFDLSTVKRFSFAGSLTRCSEAEKIHAYDIVSSIVKSGEVETLALGNGAVDPDIEILKRAVPSATLKKIELCFSHEIARTRRKSAVAPFFSSIREVLTSSTNCSATTSLKEIQIKSVFKWPYTHSELRKSAWPRCLDPLVRELGINVTNHKGVAWRPRLQLV